ncbi:MAG TPA: serpin family protein [Hyphomicrobiaceae bacterium]|nr:serpin family protein [Hyphomicrobiaceae bacterium]
MLGPINRRRALWAPLLVLASVAKASAAGMPDVEALTAGYNASGLMLYRNLAGTPGNIVLSPYSIGSALAMVRSGAGGETEREMARALKQTLPRAAAETASAKLLAILDGYDRTSKPGHCPQGAHWSGKRCEAPPVMKDMRCPPFMTVNDGLCISGPIGASATLVAANALMLPKGAGAISDAYRATVRDVYGATIREGAGVAEVNAWVKERTAGKIDRIIDRLPNAAGPVLLNAIYLKAAWGTPFAERATRDESFSLTGGQRVRVPTMHRTSELALVERAGYRAVRLDYSQRSLGMIVVLPDEIAGLDAVTRRLDAGELAALLGSLRLTEHRPVALALPRFKASFSADLVPPLQSAGIRLAFSDHADFSGITGAAPGARGLRIAAVRHRAVIEVTEAGTEAAAATAIAMAKASLPIRRPDPVPFVVDRPFLFLLIDDASGAVLFQGRIADPRSPA